MGTYTYDPNVTNICFSVYKISPASVICTVDKGLNILGGYSINNWLSSDPSANLTVIDGQNLYRGVTAVGDKTTTSNLDMEGFTIQNGRALGPTYNASDTSGVGGGMLVNKVIVTLRDLIFKNNQAKGLNTSSGAGGQADVA